MVHIKKTRRICEEHKESHLKNIGVHSFGNISVKKYDNIAKL